MNQNERMARGRKKWDRPTLTLAGTVADVRGGNGKLSPPADDSGDIRKPKGQEP